MELTPDAINFVGTLALVLGLVLALLATGVIFGGIARRLINL